MDRYKQIRDFTPEKFWSIVLKYPGPQKGPGKKGPATATDDDTSGANFKLEWNRQRVFDKLTCLVMYEKCLDSGKAKVVDVVKSKRYRQRPNPLNTIEA